MSSDESVTDDELAPYDGVLLVAFGERLPLLGAPWTLRSREEQ